MSEELQWSPESMLEVTIKQPDDFLKQESALQVEKIKHYFNRVIYCTNKANIT